MKRIIYLFLALAMAACEQPTSQQQAQQPEKQLTINDTLHTQYFDITVNNFALRSNVETGNQYTRVQGDDQSAFLIMDVTFSNTDTESRMPMEGSLFIDFNGQEYEFDQTETVMADGYGLFFSRVNPLMNISTYLVYRIPRTIKGDIFWQPGRTKQRMLLGTIE